MGTIQPTMDFTQLNNVKITKVDENELESIEVEIDLCRFCQQPIDDGIKIFSLTSLLPYLPVYVSLGDPENLPEKVCFVCVGKMNFVKDFFTQIYDTYVDLTEDVKIFLKLDMIVETPKLESSADCVQVNIEEKDSKVFDIEEKDSKVIDNEDSK